MKAFENIFGERLRMLRTAKGNMTQKEFAAELNIPQPTLSAYELGKIKPTIDAVINIADKCNVSVDWLCGRDNMQHLTNIGDVLCLFMELFEVEKYDIKTSIHDKNITIHDAEITDDARRNWIDLRIFGEEDETHKGFNYNKSLFEIVKTSYEHVQKLRRYEQSQESYEQLKAYYYDTLKSVPVVKVDHSSITDDERRRRMLELAKEELQDLDKRNA